MDCIVVLNVGLIKTWTDKNDKSILYVHSFYSKVLVAFMDLCYFKYRYAHVHTTTQKDMYMLECFRDTTAY